MKTFNYKANLKHNAEEAVAALYWCENQDICVDEKGQEVDWLHKSSKDRWLPLWKVLAWYPYTTHTFVDYEKETSEFNFCIGRDQDTQGLADLLCDVWFGYVNRKYHKNDNKTALKLQNRLTGQIVYLGWYDGRFTVTELEPRVDSLSQVFEINED